jgi:photosystem II stability/assembly factor-like uncharacterized protein
MKTISMRAFFVVLAALPGSALNQQITDKTLYDAAWNGKRLVVVGEGGFIATSDNDTVWRERNSETSAILRSVVWTGSIFIAVGQRGETLASSDGINWKEGGSADDDLYSIIWNGQLAIASGDNGMITRSSISGDSVHWANREITNTKLRINAMACNNNINNRLYVAVGEQGLILTSTDFSYWVSIKVDGVDRDLYSITWTGSEFIIVGEGNMSYCACLTSKDGKNWTVTCAEPGAPLYSVVWSGNAVIAVGYGIVKKTLNGDWERMYSSNTALHSVITKGNQLIAVGAGGCILKSSDSGVTWTPLGPHTGIVPDTRGVRKKSAFSIAIAGRSLWVTPSFPWRGRDMSVDIYSVAGRKASSAVYRADADRIEIPLNGFESGVYTCIVTVDGEKAVRPFTMLKNGDAQWLRGR